VDWEGKTSKKGEKKGSAKGTKYLTTAPSAGRKKRRSLSPPKTLFWVWGASYKKEPSTCKNRFPAGKEIKYAPPEAHKRAHERVRGLDRTEIALGIRLPAGSTFLKQEGCRRGRVRKGQKAGVKTRKSLLVDRRA